MVGQPHIKSLKKSSQSLEQPQSGFGVTLHTQEDEGGEQYCGAASVQMVLESIGAEPVEQNVLYSEINARSANDPGKEWFGAPDGLVCTLNQHRPEDYLSCFRLWGFQSGVEASRMICWAIERGVAPIVSVRSGYHWIVVVGFEASEVPKNPTDSDYQIFKFDVFDPAIGDENRSYFYSEDADGQNSKKQYWIPNYMTDVETGCWRGKYLVICDPDPLPAV